MGYIPYTSRVLGRVKRKINDFVLIIPKLSLPAKRMKRSRRSSVRKLSPNPLLCPDAVPLREAREFKISLDFRIKKATLFARALKIFFQILIPRTLKFIFWKIPGSCKFSYFVLRKQTILTLFAYGESIFGSRLFVFTSLLSACLDRENIHSSQK